MLPKATRKKTSQAISTGCHKAGNNRTGPAVRAGRRGLAGIARSVCEWLVASFIVASHHSGALLRAGWLSVRPPSPDRDEIIVVEQHGHQVLPRPFRVRRARREELAT